MGKKPANTGKGAAAAVQNAGPKTVRILRANNRAGGFIAWYGDRCVASGPTVEDCANRAVRNGFSVSNAA